MGRCKNFAKSAFLKLTTLESLLLRKSCPFWKSWMSEETKLESFYRTVRGFFCFVWLPHVAAEASHPQAPPPLSPAPAPSRITYYHIPQPQRYSSCDDDIDGNATTTSATTANAATITAVSSARLCFHTMDPGTVDTKNFRLPCTACLIVSGVREVIRCRGVGPLEWRARLQPPRGLTTVAVYSFAHLWPHAGDLTFKVLSARL